MTKHSEATFNEIAATIGFKGVGCGIEAFDLWTVAGAYAGVVVNSPKGWRFYYNMNATKGSARRFATVQDVLSFIRERRIKKGLTKA